MGLIYGLKWPPQHGSLQGIEDADEATRKALLAFTLHMATGDVAAATSAMRNIRGRTAWGTMARVAVRARRPDILSLCLDHLENLPAAQVMLSLFDFIFGN